MRFNIVINDQKICAYIADYTYYDAENNFIVEDAKGVETDVFRLKKKLMKAVNDIEIKISRKKWKKVLQLESSITILVLSKEVTTLKNTN